MAGDASYRVERVAVPDGSFEMKVWPPAAGRGPGVLLVQEIFGVSDYIRAVAEDLATLGYVVAAPDLFWRIKPGHDAVHDAQGLAESLELSSRFDLELGVADAEAAFGRLAALPEVRGGVGIVGFCLGGTIAYFLAARVRTATVISFYGSAVPGQLDVLDRIGVPIQFHFGGQDPYIVRDQVAAVETAVRGRAGAEIHVEEEAGHAFHNRKAPMFYVPDAADRAWHRAEEFLARHLPVQSVLPRDQDS